MGRKSVSDERKIEKKNNIRNMKLMTDEAVQARSAGVSYGMLKANMGPDFKESEYPVNIRDFVRVTKDKEKTKTIARIKAV